MTDHDFIAEAREAAKRIPDPPKAPANVVPFRRTPTATRTTTPRPKPTPPQPPRAA